MYSVAGYVNKIRTEMLVMTDTSTFTRSCLMKGYDEVNAVRFRPSWKSSEGWE